MVGKDNDTTFLTFVNNKNNGKQKICCMRENELQTANGTEFSP